MDKIDASSFSELSHIAHTQKQVVIRVFARAETHPDTDRVFLFKKCLRSRFFRDWSETCAPCSGRKHNSQYSHKAFLMKHLLFSTFPLSGPTKPEHICIMLAISCLEALFLPFSHFQIAFSTKTTFLNKFFTLLGCYCPL